jgi:hypothetical protein
MTRVAAAPSAIIAVAQMCRVTPFMMSSCVRTAQS